MTEPPTISQKMASVTFCTNKIHQMAQISTCDA
jgi:hypothetical protein